MTKMSCRVLYFSSCDDSCHPCTWMTCLPQVWAGSLPKPWNVMADQYYPFSDFLIFRTKNAQILTLMLTCVCLPETRVVMCVSLDWKIRKGKIEESSSMNSLSQSKGPSQNLGLSLKKQQWNFEIIFRNFRGNYTQSTETNMLELIKSDPGQDNYNGIAPIYHSLSVHYCPRKRHDSSAQVAHKNTCLTLEVSNIPVLYLVKYEHL